MRIDAVLLAAGNSVRFGGNKLLTPFHGSPLYRYTFDAVNAAGCFAQVVVVTQYEEIAAAAAAYGYACVHNEHPELGQSHSVALGTAAALEADAILFAVCDQPYLRPESLRRLAEHGSIPYSAQSIWGAKGQSNPFPAPVF